MTYREYIAYIGDYKELGSAEELLGQIGFPPEMTLSADGLLKAVNIIAAVADGKIKELVLLSDLSMRAFALKYMIPYRTMQDWCSGVRTPPDYVAILIGWEMITELPTEVDTVGGWRYMIVT